MKHSPTIDLEVKANLLVCADGGAEFIIVESPMDEDVLPLFEQMVAVSRGIA
jgi:hypothetical protein